MRDTEHGTAPRGRHPHLRLSEQMAGQGPARQCLMSIIFHRETLPQRKDSVGRKCCAHGSSNFVSNHRVSLHRSDCDMPIIRPGGHTTHQREWNERTQSETNTLPGLTSCTATTHDQMDLRLTLSCCFTSTKSFQTSLPVLIMSASSSTAAGASLISVSSRLNFLVPPSTCFIRSAFSFFSTCRR